MPLQFFNAGLDSLSDWETATFEWALLTAGSFNGDDSTVADVLVTATEATVTGYARVAASTKVRIVDDAGDQIIYLAADPNFGSLTVGETVTAVLLYRLVTTDADSIPVGWVDINPTDTAAFDPFVIYITDNIVAYLDQAA